ncbi:hypothetical protein G7072_02915 [Nocardioides sp. HDW12B]|uniref:hypothetical protein n=1 Tax=Nocardioides sp. HDW12B TaxID=2714939 RepID=UPI00140A5DDE|nr:hypothetical protein [Nocardioides sp. HDW12B]QIK65429.1 hypothetical protein G7072_02915 [Nocardioides sp. HDW12B]
MSPLIEPPNSVLLLVGREEFTPPQTFAGEVCVSSSDCIAVGVLSVDDGPTSASLTQVMDGSGLVTLGDFRIESEGHLSVRDVYNREHASLGVEAGSVRVTVLGNDKSEPDEVIFLASSG